jgi:hypothetical protein
LVVANLSGQLSQVAVRIELGQDAAKRDAAGFRKSSAIARRNDWVTVGGAARLAG